MQVDIENIAFKELRSHFGENAQFRPRQLDALKAILNQSRVLLVQKTGWGKSLIYIIATKIIQLMNPKKGITCVVTPLLSLMDNQIEIATSFGLNAKKFTSSSKTEQKKDIISLLQTNLIDILYITPETFNKMYKEGIFDDVVINLMVIDEAHCISNFGYDFRPDYLTFLNNFFYLNTDAHVLATTAIVNKKVMEDIKHQLGEDIHVIAGDLERKDIFQDVITFDQDEDKFAWLLDHIKDFKGQGLIYCKSTHNVDILAGFLQYFGESALPYYAKMTENQAIKNLMSFIHGSTRILVATSKLAVGFCKSNISFVIIFNNPKNIIDYYQKISIASPLALKDNPHPYAYTVFLASPENLDVIQNFQDQYFPLKKDALDVFNVICKYGVVKLADIEQLINLSRSYIKTILKYLEQNLMINYSIEHKTYKSTGHPFTYDDQSLKDLTNLRLQEKKSIIELQHTKRCLTEFTLESLNCKVKTPCNHCANCLPNLCISREVSEDTKKKNLKYWYEYKPLQGIEIACRKQGENKKISKSLLTNNIWALSFYEEIGLGEVVAKEINDNECFGEYVTNCVIKFLQVNNILKFKAITYIPSSKRQHVKKLAEHLAKHLNLQLLDCFKIKDNQSIQQKSQNSIWKSKQIRETYAYIGPKNINSNIILLDDIYDSGWTITICGAKLRSKGCDEVQPLTLSATYKRIEAIY